MLVLFVGDSHGNIPYMLKAVEVGIDAGADLVVQVGDFGFWPKSDFAVRVDKMFKKAELPLGVVRGNHDEPEQAFSSRWQTNIFEPGLSVIRDGSVLDFNGTKVGFMGGAVSVDQESRFTGLSWWPNEVPSKEDFDYAIENGPVEVWVTHDSVEVPPVMNAYSFGPRIDTQLSIQRNQMRRVFHALKPRLHIHGHWHCRYTAETDYGRVIGLDFENMDGFMLVSFDENVTVG